MSLIEPDKLRARASLLREMATMLSDPAEVARTRLEAARCEHDADVIERSRQSQK
jgi:hypothetical protein